MSREADGVTHDRSDPVCSDDEVAGDSLFPCSRPAKKRKRSGIGFDARDLAPQVQSHTGSGAGSPENAMQLCPVDRDRVKRARENRTGVRSPQNAAATIAYDERTPCCASSTHDRAQAQGVEHEQAIGLDQNPGTDRAQRRAPLDNHDIMSGPAQRQGGCKSANPGAGHDDARFCGDGASARAATVRRAPRSSPPAHSWSGPTVRYGRRRRRTRVRRG
jgi:hypothetical protein